MKTRLAPLGLLFSLFLSVPLSMQAQVAGDKAPLAQLTRQRSFGRAVPAGNYSGITRIGDDEYAVVSDKSADEGYHVFRIVIDSLKGTVRSVENKGFHRLAAGNRDLEGIAWLPWRRSLLLSGEADGRIVEYGVEGMPTGRVLQLPKARPNLGYESLTACAADSTVWTVSEAALPGDTAGLLRIKAFDDDLRLRQEWLYQLDAPTEHRRLRFHVAGVSELLALGDGRLLVLEREICVRRRGIGSSVHCKLYMVECGRNKEQGVNRVLRKVLVQEWQSRLNLLRRSWANYEGMCLGPTLADGTQVVLLVSDSQDHYRGVLRDWFRTVLLPNLSKAPSSL